MDEIHKRHREALKRIEEIKSEIRVLEKEKKDLETESYVKARVMSEPFSRRDSEILKEYGQRLKFIERRTREIDSTIADLAQERDRIKKL